jgi:monoamine oxidase
MRVTRRSFLYAAAAPIAASAIGCSNGDAGRVLVVGGGLCGLVVLDRLRKSGRDATLLEAADRLGGRILTVRAGLSPGLRAEMGAERVGIDDRGVRALLSELGVGTAAYPPPTRPMLFEWKGRRYRFQAASDLPAELLAGLSERERAGAPLGILHAVLEGANAPANDDERSGIEWLRSLGMTKRGEELVRAFVALPLDGMPAAVFHRAAMRDLRARQSDTVAGGTDRIVEGLAARHPGAIVKDAPIASVRQADAGVSLVDARGRTFEGAHAVFCLPLAPLRRLDFAGGMPPALSERIGRLEVACETKIATEVPESGGPEYTFRDGSPRVSWRLPETSATRSFVEQALDWEQNVVQRSEEYWSMGSLTRDFSRDPLVGGAYAYARSGTGPQGTVREGRLVFAGGDLSDAPGWMEGAVRAAEQALEALAG